MKAKKINTVPNTIWQNPLHFVAFGFGSGAMPVAPGTFGTLMSIPFYLLIRPLPLFLYCLILLLFTLLAIWLCTKVSNEINIQDHPGMVIDEFVGFGFTMIAAPSGWKWIIIGFLLFRLFDIWKPQPIRWLDEHIISGFGTVLDDIVAGLFAFACLQVIALFF